MQQRRAFLDEQCAGDPELRAAVEDLLRFDAEAESDPDFLPSPAASVRATLPLPAEPGLPAYDRPLSRPAPARRRWHGYRLRGRTRQPTPHRCHQGDSRRTTPQPSSSVASATKQKSWPGSSIPVSLRYTKRGSVTTAGRSSPWSSFAGCRWTSMRAVAVLDPRARLELLAKVCDAVQHAHDKGVIHRDLKPGNILVDVSGQPKVLDFGVAHVTAADLLTTAGRTQAGQLLGTLELHESGTGRSRPGRARRTVGRVHARRHSL